MNRPHQQPASKQSQQANISPASSDLAAAMQLLGTILAVGMLKAAQSAVIDQHMALIARQPDSPPTGPRGYVQLEYFNAPECPSLTTSLDTTGAVANVDIEAAVKNPFSETGYLEIVKSGDISAPGLSLCLPIKTFARALSFKFITVSDERPIPKCNVFVYQDGNCKLRNADAPAANTRDGGNKCYNVPPISLDFANRGPPPASITGGKSFRLSC